MSRASRRPSRASGESADGSTVGTNGAEGTFRLFDAGSLTQLGEPLALRLGSFAGTDDAFNRVALPTPTGVRMFDLRRTSMLGAACARAGQNLSRTSWSQFFPGEPYRATCVDIAQDRDPHRAKR